MGGGGGGGGRKDGKMPLSLDVINTIPRLPIGAHKRQPFALPVLLIDAAPTSPPHALGRKRG